MEGVAVGTGAAGVIDDGLGAQDYNEITAQNAREYSHHGGISGWICASALCHSGELQRVLLCTLPAAFSIRLPFLPLVFDLGHCCIEFMSIGRVRR